MRQISVPEFFRKPKSKIAIDFIEPILQLLLLGQGIQRRPHADSGPPRNAHHPINIEQLSLRQHIIKTGDISTEKIPVGFWDSAKQIPVQRRRQMAQLRRLDIENASPRFHMSSAPFNKPPIGITIFHGVRTGDALRMSQ